MAEAAAHVTALFHRHGITGFKEPMAHAPELAACAGADRAGRPKLHVAACLTRQSAIGGGTTPMETFRAWREVHATAHVRTGFATFFRDGVPPSLTAAVIAPHAIPCRSRPAGTSAPGR